MLPLRHIIFEGAETARAASLRLWRPARKPENPPGAADPFLIWLLSRGGLDHRAYRSTALQRRLTACLRQLRVSSPEAARTLLERRPDLVPFALGTVLIGVTHFFRDRDVFARLKETTLPALLAARERLRICSIGCSSGQELYSVAMLLAELGALERCELLGIDCRLEAVARAKAGLYADHELAGMDSARLRNFFRAEPKGWRIIPQIAARTDWREGDLFALPRGSWDLVLCRNVLIYLNPSASQRAWERLGRLLAPGATLLTGKAEKAPASTGLLRVAPSTYVTP